MGVPLPSVTPVRSDFQPRNNPQAREIIPFLRFATPALLPSVKPARNVFPHRNKPRAQEIMFSPNGKPLVPLLSVDRKVKGSRFAPGDLVPDCIHPKSVGQRRLLLVRTGGLAAAFGNGSAAV